MDVGIHCTFGGWIRYDGNTITADICEASGEVPCTTKRNLAQLRRLWAKHVLTQPSSSQQQTSDGQNSTAIWDKAAMDKVYEMIDTAVARSAAKKKGGVGSEKVFGQGSGGWSGMSEDGVVLKRDSGLKNVGHYAEGCDKEPGGIFQSGDSEVWMTWNGWSTLSTRDGRWRPSYHLEILLLHLTTVIDFGLTRARFRERQARWACATEWAWLDTPLDVPQEFMDAMRTDASEMIRREKLRAQDLNPHKFAPEDAGTKQQRLQRLHDRAAHVAAYHTAGQGLDTGRGLLAAWALLLPNDMIDYERDVLCGESNNMIRSFTSSQQIVDASAWLLRGLLWSFLNSDFDLADVFVGVLAFNAAYWRYNTAKFVIYEARSIRNVRPTTPREISDVAEILATRNAVSVNEAETYGDIYQVLEKRVRAAYDGCTCVEFPEGHEASKLLAAVMNEGGGDELEHRLLAAIISLNNGANSGDIRCECGMDLLMYEGFVRFFHPDQGLVARLHYRSGNLDKGNTIVDLIPPAHWDQDTISDDFALDHTTIPLCPAGDDEDDNDSDNFFLGAFADTDFSSPSTYPPFTTNPPASEQPPPDRATFQLQQTARTNNNPGPEPAPVRQTSACTRTSAAPSRPTPRFSPSGPGESQNTSFTTDHGDDSSPSQSSHPAFSNKMPPPPSRLQHLLNDTDAPSISKRMRTSQPGADAVNTASAGSLATPSAPFDDDDDDLFGEDRTTQGSELVEGEDLTTIDLTEANKVPEGLKKPEQDNRTKISKFQCVICMDDATAITVTHCGKS
ncbi:uncharacterized protein MAM_01490 [Metarhizium album ARSEF 1941]|uniref:Uncharacterized protein n=1 Tax=Metarhizium album (strain ARSEF 1941) TaxID=1081103 RepID=A0A0B2WWW9_METAS|nr:uncharacterized protein MAM_01490 [Metarhizium album ARSEF 1941]KHO00712.1 hypothetical protein MAM_01490 [Metarhizium album ARSEF 1941]